MEHQQPMSIRLLFEQAIQFDEPYTAHFIYFAVKNGKVTMEEPFEKLVDIHLSVEELNELSAIKAADVLNMRPVKLYAIQKNTTTFVFYFAKNALEVQTLHNQLYVEWEKYIIDAYNQMIDKSIYYPETKVTKTFRQLMKETVEFPRWVCEMEKG